MGTWGQASNPSYKKVSGQNRLEEVISLAPKVMLVAMPWGPYYVPQMSIAALHGHLRERGIDSEARYWSIEIAREIGFISYLKLAESYSYISESLYSYLVFPEMRNKLLREKSIQKVVGEIRSGTKNESSRVRLSWTPEFFRQFEQIHQEILDRYDWSRYSLVGFTLNYGQTVPSLYMAREIKKRNPHCKIIIGGAEASNTLGASLVENFGEFDFACNGEGEKPLANLIKAIARGAEPDAIENIQGLISRRRERGVVVNPPDQLADLGGLTIPDFDGYFEALDSAKNFPPHIQISLGIEGSRGCPFACSFCALNIQWTNFRSRPPKKIAETMEALCKKYKVFHFIFVDNITPQNVEDVFEEMAKPGLDFQFFYEIRANLSRRTLAKMKKAGASRVQIGIEALSTPLLRKFNKKTRFITNLQCMKFCEELRIETASNLIVNHPLSTEEDVEETIRNMEYCRAYRPPESFAKFSLEVGAPDHESPKPERYSVTGNSEHYRLLYPESLYQKLCLTRKAYKLKGPKAPWHRIEKPFADWKDHYETMSQELGGGSRILAYYDGGTFLTIEDYRYGFHEKYDLNERERAVYLYSDEIKSWHSIRQHFPNLPEQELKEILSAFIDEKLMYEEDGYYLSLAMTPYPEKEHRHVGSVSSIASAVPSEKLLHVI